MIVIVAVMRIHPHKVKAYEASTREYIAKVRANEPNTVFYDNSKNRDEPNTYTSIEVFKDTAAIEFHTHTDYFKAAIAATADCFDGEVAVRQSDSLVGIP